MPALQSLAPAAPPPVPEEEYVDPAVAAPAPEQAPPLSSGGGVALQSLGSAPQQDYTAAPEAPPSNFIPGSTYRPMPVGEEPAPVQAPIPTLTELAPTTSTPTDPWSGVGDVLGTARDAAARGDIKGVATTFLDAASLPMQQNQNKISERAKDQALYGDANRTVDLSPQGLKDHPENLNPGLLVGAFTSEFEGMPSWVPSDSEQQIGEFYNDPVEGPARQAEAQEREKTEGVDAWRRVYEEGQHMTLETGGLGGMVRGMFRGAGTDPLTYLSGGGTALGDEVATGLRNAGHIGTARGLEATVKGANIAMDPLFEGGSTLLGKLSPVFRPGKEVASQIGQDKVLEAVDAATLAASQETPNVGTYTGQTPNPFDPNVPPAAAAPVPSAANAVPPVEPSIHPAAAPRVDPKVVEREATNTRVADRLASPATRETPPTTENPFNRSLVRNELPEGGARITWDNGKAPTFGEFEKMGSQLVDVHPHDFVPGQYGNAMSQNTLAKSAMTQEGFMYDNWPMQRQAEAKAKGIPQSRIDAGRRGVQFQSARLSKWGDVELQQQLDSIQRAANDRMARGEPMDKIVLDLGNRITALSEALDASTHKQSFEITVGKYPFRYWAGTDTILRPRISGMDYILPERVNSLMNQPWDARIFGFKNATDIDGSITQLMNDMGIDYDKAIKWAPDFQQRFINMIQDPDSFKYGGKDWKKAMQRDIDAGVITPERAAQLSSYKELRRYLANTQKLYSEVPVKGKAGELYTLGNDAQINYRMMKQAHAEYKNLVEAADDELPVDVAGLHMKLEAPTDTTALKLTEEITGGTRKTITPEELEVLAKNDPAGRPADVIASDIEHGYGVKVEGAPKSVTPPPKATPISDPEKFANHYPNLAAKLDEANVAAGKEPFWKRKSSTSGTRMEAMGKADFIDDPEYAGSGLAQGFRMILDQVDNNHPLTIDGQKVRMYTYVKQIMDELDELPGMVKRTAADDKKGWKNIESIQKGYKDIAEEFGFDDITKLNDVEKRELVAARVVKDWADQQPQFNIKQSRGAVSDLGRFIKNLVDFRRGVGLTNYAAAPRQLLNQYFGNIWGLFMGKPSAVFDMTNLAELRRHVQNLHGEGRGLAPNTATKKLFDGFGASAPNSMLTGGTRTYAGHEVEVTGALGRLRDFVAPKKLRDWVSGPDELAKAAVARQTFGKGMRREVDALPANAKATAARMGTKRAGMEGITAQIEKKLPAALEKYRTPHFDRPQFTGEQLEMEIKNIFKSDVDRGTINRESLNVYADRMKRDWNTVVNSEKQYAASEVKRVMFSWDNTKADDVIQNVFLYHYWATRAGYLYSKEMLKKPYLITMYMDAAGQMQQEAETGDYPNWMKGFTRILNSAPGVALFMSPLDMIGTAIHLNEMELGGEDAADETLTALGRAKGMLSFAMSPAIELALTYAGAFGGTPQMPNNMTGLNRMTGFAADVINWANYNGLLGDLGKDAQGNPIPVPPRPLDDVILRVAGHFGMPVTPSLSSFEKQETNYLQERLVQDAGGYMDPVELNKQVSEIMDRAAAGDVDPRLEAAQAEALANTMQGPQYEGLPEALRPIFGALTRYVSPVRMTAQSEFGFKMQYPGSVNTLGGDPSILESMNEAGADPYAIKNTKRMPYQTERAMALGVAYADWWDGGNPEFADISNQYSAIGHNEIGQPLTVGGVEYSVADVNAMGDKERWNLAEDWLADQGYSKADINAMWDAKDEIVANNPDVGGYLAFKDYIKNYPGGPNAFVDEAVKTSPSFAAYMADHGTPGTPDYYEFTDTPDAYLALSGERGGIYDPENVPPQGNIPGLPAGINFNVKYQTDKQINDAVDGGESGFQDFVNTVTTDSNQIYAAQQWLDANYPGVIADGDIPYDIYKAMKAAGVTAPKLEDASAAYEYRGWLRNNATATDLSVEAFLDQRDSTGTSPEDLPLATPEMIAAQGGYEVRQSAPISRDELQSIGIASTMAQYSPLYTGPGTNNAISFEVPSGLPGVKEIYRDSGGWSQVYVPVAGGGYKIGWVPTQALAAA